MIEELLASHSTDLQQRAYELQAVIGLDAHAVENIMPSDGSCKDFEVIPNFHMHASVFVPYPSRWLFNMLCSMEE